LDVGPAQLYDTAYDLEHAAAVPSLARSCSCERPIGAVDEHGDEARCQKCGRTMPTPVRIYRGVTYFSGHATLPPA
jgi:hypothetical protein